MAEEQMGRITVVGIGPGGRSHLTPKALAAIEACDVVIGYKSYTDNITDLIAGKRVVISGMRREIERAVEAVEAASLGDDVVVVSSGDPGIYGMAGLVLEVVNEKGMNETIEVEMVPGVTALSAAAAALGAPLMHDFCSISLSDLLTSWELILKRLKAAAEADFVIALYNPRSQGRPGHLRAALDVIAETREGTTPVGVVRNASRDDQTAVVTTLDEIEDASVDMLTLVLVGNSQTKIIGGRIVTPRGYEVRL